MGRVVLYRIALTAMLVCTGTAVADTPIQRIDAGKSGDPAFVGDQFGTAIAVSGPMRVIGMSTADGVVARTGAVVVLKRSANDRWEPVARIVAEDGSTGDQFGHAVAISGNDVLVGAPYRLGQAPRAGAVYVFRAADADMTQWRQVAKFTRATAGEGLEYGRRLSASGGRVAVGQDGECGGEGVDILRATGGTWSIGATIDIEPDACFDVGFGVALDGNRLAISNALGAHLYQLSGEEWTFVGKVTRSWSNADVTNVALSGNTLILGNEFNRFKPEQTASGEFFVFDSVSDRWVSRRLVYAPFDTLGCGISIEVSGDRAIFGCVAAMDGVQESTAFGLFQRNAGGADAWGSIMALNETGGERLLPRGDEWVPSAVTFDGDDVLLGVPSDDDEGIDAGRVAVYRWDGTTAPTPQRSLTQGDNGAGEKLGYAIDTDGEWLLAGAVYDSELAYFSGKVYAYRRGANDQYELAQELLPVDARATQYFGQAILLHDRFAFIGATGLVHVNGMRAGGIVVYERVADQWVRRGEVFAPDPRESGRFGRVIAMSGDTIVVGSPPYSTTPVVGAVYVFRFDPAAPTTWPLVRKIEHGLPSTNRSFGYAVAIDADTLVAGTGRGRSSIFRRDLGGTDAWGWQQDLDAPNSVFSGSSFLAVDHGVVVVGSVEEFYPAGPNDVYVYKEMGGQWPRTQKIALTSPVGGGLLSFGGALAIDNGALAVTGTIHEHVGDGLPTITGAFVDLFRANSNGTFQLLDRRTVRGTPSPSLEATPVPVKWNGDELVIGMNGDASPSPPHAPNAGAVYRIAVGDLPLIRDGFE